MMMLFLLQAVADQGATASTPTLIASIATAVVVTLKAISDFRKGKRRGPELAEQLDKRLVPLTKAVDALKDDVRDLRGYVIGVDGKNGLRGDVRELKDRVDGVEERERDRLERKVGALDRRSGS